MDNPYIPYPVRIDEIQIATEDKSLKTFKFVFLNKADEEKFNHHAGQFAELSIPGKGEIPLELPPHHGKGICKVHGFQNRRSHLISSQHEGR